MHFPVFFVFWSYCKNLLHCSVLFNTTIEVGNKERQPISKGLLQLTTNILFWMTQYKWDKPQQHSWSNNNSLATARMSDYSVDGSSKFSKSNTRPSSFPWLEPNNIQYKVGVLCQPWTSHPKNQFHPLRNTATIHRCHKQTHKSTDTHIQLTEADPLPLLAKKWKL